MKNKYDFLKAFAILLVVLGHVTNHYMDALPTKVITLTIYLFHMSLFMAISGAVFKMGLDRGKYQNFVPFITAKVSRLIVPFCATSIFVLAPTLSFCKMTEVGYWQTVTDILVRGGKHLWFVQALFWIFLVVWVSVRVKFNKYGLLAVAFALQFFIALVVLPSGVEVNKYFSIGLAISKLPMFVLGMILVGVKYSKKGTGAWIVGCMLFGGVQVISHSPRIDSVVSPLFSATIVGLIVSLSDYAYKWFKDSCILAFLVKNSFGIYLFHMTPIYFIRYWGCDAWPLWVSVPATFVFSLIVSVVLIMLVRGCRLGVLIGEK